MKKFLVTLFILTALGLCFSGYLSAVKLFSGSCAFNEPCPYFLGYPSCWYGFAMYLAMFIVTGFAVFGKMDPARAIKTDTAVSALGIVFAGSFVTEEIVQSSITGTLGLSTCVYGLIFYIAIFITSLMAWRKAARGSAQPARGML